MLLCRTRLRRLRENGLPKDTYEPEILQITLLAILPLQPNKRPDCILKLPMGE